jgi:prevent-host-death family protein
MKHVSLSEVKDKLSALVEEADTTHEIIQITRHRRVTAVVMSTDDLDLAAQRFACGLVGSCAPMPLSPGRNPHPSPGACCWRRAQQDRHDQAAISLGPATAPNGV